MGTSLRPEISSFGWGGQVAEKEEAFQEKKFCAEKGLESESLDQKTRIFVTNRRLRETEGSRFITA